MSIAAIRQALETQLATIVPSVDIAFENVAYTPKPGIPYQQPTLLPAQPANIEMGAGYTEQGIFQVNLFYPINAGSAAAQTRAELIRSAFAIGTSLTSGGVTVLIIATPQIGPARPEDDRFMVPVKVRFQAQINGG